MIENRWLCILVPAAVMTACSAPRDDGRSGDRSSIDHAAETITAGELSAHIEALASDAFEGRAPGTDGEQKTVDYLTQRFRDLGLAPGNPDGTYVQAVPLVGFKAEPQASLHTPRGVIDLAFPTQAVALTRRFVPAVEIEGAPIVFVGYGVVAPEYGWDDYKDVDVRGKAIVMLINDPPVVRASDARQLDEGVFKGRAMTYYGRWTYKYEIAAEKGAAAAILVHEEGPAGYPWEVVSGSWGRENFDIEVADGNAGRAAVEGWIHLDVARDLFARCGHDFEKAKAAARTRDFRPLELGAKAEYAIANTLRKVASRNVVARVIGADPALAAEHVVYTAHWDHLGRDPSREGDGIFNGAVDNASGCAALLEIAGAFAALSPPLPRSVLFLAVTAEEKGLLGSKYYASHPLWPLERALCDINMDGLNPWGRTHDLVAVSLGHTTLDELLAEVTAAHGRHVSPDPEPEKGLFFRSDHFEFAKRGVPALDADSGVNLVDRPTGWGKKKRAEYTANDYHKPSDEPKPGWDLSGAAADAQLLFEIGCRVAAGEHRPAWKPASEFATRRAGSSTSAGAR